MIRSAQVALISIPILTAYIDQWFYKCLLRKNYFGCTMYPRQCSGDWYACPIPFLRLPAKYRVVSYRLCSQDFLGRSTARSSFLIWTHRLNGIAYNNAFVPEGASSTEKYKERYDGKGSKLQEDGSWGCRYGAIIPTYHRSWLDSKFSFLCLHFNMKCSEWSSTNVGKRFTGALPCLLLYQHRLVAIQIQET